jgi:HTH-type transcriptional regulator/antitoxin HigA
MALLSEAEYKAALRRIEALWGAAPESPEAEKLNRLVDEVVAYENEYWPIGEILHDDCE